MSSSSESDLSHESSYEMLSESMIISDDEDQSSVASLDEHSGEDYSVGDSDSLVEFEDTDSPPPQHGEATGIPDFGGLDEHTLTDIDLRQDLDSHSPVVFDETFPNERVSVFTTIREFDQSHVRDVVSALNLRIEGQGLPVGLKVTARQTMGPEVLKVDGPFRLMIVGNPTTMETIIEKIGAALAVTALDSSTSSLDDEQRASRFNIVPVSSFCTDSSPEVELIESFGLEMEVDVCISAICTKGEKNTETYSLGMTSNKSVVYKFEQGTASSVEPRSYKIPHFAVVYCSEHDGAAVKQTRMHARSFLRKFDVPMVVITDSTDVEKGTNITEVHHIDNRTLHLCIESGNNPQKISMIHKRLPVDLNTFLSLDVRQMNRNIALLTGLYEQPAPAEAEPETMEDTTVLEKKVEEKAEEKKGIWVEWFQALSKINVGWIGIAGWFFAFGVFTTAIFGNSYLRTPEESAVIPTVPVMQHTDRIVISAPPKPVVTPASSTSLLNAISTHLASAASASSGSSTTATQLQSASCSPKPEWNTLLLDGAGLSGNESEDFKLHIIGDHHILLRPPHKFAIMRKAPTFFIDVFRNEQFVSSEISKLFDGVYAIQIPKEDAWGLMNVTVSTKSKPIVKEVFELDFGTPWLKVTHWKDLAGQAKVTLADVARKYQEVAAERSQYVKQVVLGRARGMFLLLPVLSELILIF